MVTFNYLKSLELLKAAARSVFVKFSNELYGISPSTLQGGTYVGRGFHHAVTFVGSSRAH
eukprot:14261890-Alexandrium_andersonii.AAC.1